MAINKIQYPGEGLEPLVNGNIQSGKDNIYEAADKCNFDIPYEFAYRDYLNSLGKQIREYGDRLNEIHEQIRSLDSLLDEKSRKFETTIQNLDEPDIIQQERRIV